MDYEVHYVQKARILQEHMKRCYRKEGVRTSSALQPLSAPPLLLRLSQVMTKIT